MTKQLLFFRHAKSDWAASFSRDHDRPVAKRGIVAAQTMGQLLANLDKVPDFALSSSAVRAHTTLELAHQAGAWPCPTAVTADLYEATVEQVVQVIHQQSDQYHSLMLVGHEPTWSETIAYLGGGAVRMPTAAIACLEFDIACWGQVDQGRGTLLWLLPPKLFTQANGL